MAPAFGCETANTHPGTKSASCPQIAQKPPIRDLTGIKLKRAVAPEVGRGSVCARSGEIGASELGCRPGPAARSDFAGLVVVIELPASPWGSEHEAERVARRVREDAVVARQLT